MGLCLLVLLWPPSMKAEQGLRFDLAGISRKYQIDFQLARSGLKPNTNTSLSLASEPFTEGELSRYISLFSAEFTLYPPELIREAGLKRVIVCKKLRLDGQPRAAVPDFELGDLYVDILPRGFYAIYLRQVLHHEFYHMIDFRQDGLKDEAWTALNQPGFRYGAGGNTAQTNESTSLATRAYPGFLNHYSTTGVEEDKAEIFSRLMVVPRYVERRSKADMVMNSKVFRLKESLGRFCPAVDGQFWAQAQRAHPPLRMVQADLPVTEILWGYLVQPLTVGCLLAGAALLAVCRKARGLRIGIYTLSLALCLLAPCVRAAFRIWWDYSQVEPYGVGLKLFWSAMVAIPYLAWITAIAAHWADYKRKKS
jgi:hypothetical protein